MHLPSTTTAMTFKAQPYHLFIIVSLVLFVLSFFVSSASMDLLLHDTYYVMDSATVYMGASLFFLLLWLFYLFTKKLLYSNLLSWMHIAFTTLSALLVVFFIYRANSASLHTFNQMRGSSFLVLNTVVVNAIFSLLLVQLLFLWNFIMGIIKWAGKKKS